MDPTLYDCYVAVAPEGGGTIDISELIENASWTEDDGELAARITFDAKNDETSMGRLSSLAPPGSWICVLYSYDGGGKTEAVKGKIKQWKVNADASRERFSCKAYDICYDLQESQDVVYYSKGQNTKTVISKLLSDWGLSLGKYTGPSETHDKIQYKNEKIGTIITKLLKEAHDKGGKDAILRASGSSVDVVAYGGNSPVYTIEEGVNLVSVSHTIDIGGIVTRVKIYSHEDKNGKPKIRGQEDGKTKYGIHQRIQIMGKKDTEAEAKKTAKQVLKDEGDPDETITIKAPDIPTIRKGYKIKLDTNSCDKGEYFITSITHQIENKIMTLTVKKTSKFNT
jgi:hypothetical protein